MSATERDGMPAGLPYHLVLTAGRPGWWRYLIGLAVLLGGLIVVGPLVVLIPFAIYYVGASSDPVDSITALLDTSDPTPAGLAYLNLSLAAAIPLTWFVVKVVHGLRPGWLASIRPGENGTLTVNPAFLAACSTPVLPASTIKSASETFLPL